MTTIGRKLSPNSLAALELMKRFGDAEGNVNYERMHAEEPNWRNLIGNPEKPSVLFSANRTTGRFKNFMEGRYATGESETMPVRHEDLNADEKLVMEIGEKYLKPDGGMDWQRAYAEHPEWKAQLSFANNGKGEKGMYIAGSLRRSGVLTVPPSNKSKAVMKVWAQRRAESSNQPLTPEEEWILGIAQQYRVRTKVLWNKAVAEHPEWNERLQIPGSTTAFAKAKYVLKQLMKRGLLTGKQKRNLAPPSMAPPAPVVANGAGPSPEELQAIERRITQEVNRTIDMVLNETPLCPKCGRDNRRLFRETLLNLKLNS